MRRAARGAGAKHGSEAYPEARRPLSVAELSQQANTNRLLAQAKPYQTAGTPRKK